jgi:hypothetical protein
LPEQGVVFIFLVVKSAGNTARTGLRADHFPDAACTVRLCG